jgi:hypothetical protein
MAERSATESRGRRRRPGVVGVAMIAFVSLAGAEGLLLPGIHVEQPLRFVAADPCVPPEFVSTRGWKVRRIGRGHVVAPRDFRVTGSDSMDWDGRSIHVRAEEGDEDAAGLGEDCRITLGGRDALVVTRRSAERVELVAWFFSEMVDEDFGRGLGTVESLSSDHLPDEAMLWTILRGMHESLPRPDLPRPEQADLADRECPVQLLLEASPPDEPGSRVWISSWLTATLVNRGTAPITLVAPGDGSDDGMRTPVTWLSIRRGRERVIPNPLRRRCGNMNPLRASDLLVLEPGRAIVLESLWTHAVLDRAGTYDVRLHYRNQPAHEWAHPDEQPADLLARVRESLPCEIVSNPVRIVVTEQDITASRER